MGHWLEDAENQQKGSKRRSSAFVEKIERKKLLIRQNYEKYGEDYDSFIKQMQGLVARTNELPEEMRHPFKKITILDKKSKLHNHLHVFSSSRRYKKRNYSLLDWFKLIHAKHIRVLYIFVSKEMGFIDFELKENFLIRERMKDKKADPKEQHGRRPHSKDRLHVIYRYPIQEINRDTGLEIIDWLVFKSSLTDLSFWSKVPDENKIYF